MRIFALKSCDICRKALQQLQAAGYRPQVIDIRADMISDADIDSILVQFGAAAINRASTTWRGLSDAERLCSPAQLLRDYPTVMKRPVIDHQGRWTIGWGPTVQKALI